MDRKIRQRICGEQLWSAAGRKRHAQGECRDSKFSECHDVCSLLQFSAFIASTGFLSYSIRACSVPCQFNSPIARSAFEPHLCPSGRVPVMLTAYVPSIIGKLSFLGSQQ